MGTTCKGTSHVRDHNFIAPDLLVRNCYEGPEIKSTEEHKGIFESRQSFRKYSPLLLQIEQSSHKSFQDTNFHLQNSTKLSLLYNYSHMKAAVYTTENTAFNSFNQSEIELSYLSCVMYHLCNNKFLLDSIFETRILNDFDLYILKMFCNGKLHQVVIDDSVPTVRETMIYSKLIRGREIWPVLLEKAWCKQIGSYEAAKGLSPQDAFEEITGIPAYSYSIDYNRHMIQEILEEASKRDQWVALIARVNLKDVENRQVFYLEKVENDQFWIRSAYNRFQFLNHRIQDSNLIKINLIELIQHFQFYTIGYFRSTFETTVFPHRSMKREEIVYQVLVKHEDLISIRFIQFYEGYFDVESRLNYAYSPVFLQLYNANYEFIDSCQGCDRSSQGSRSSHLSSNPFEVLRSGKYYLKVQVDWVNERSLNEGSIVTYSSRGNVTIQACQEKFEALVRKFHERLIERVRTVTEISDNIQVTNVEKRNGVVLGLKNRGKEGVERVKIDMSKSKNIRLKYCENSGLEAILILEKDEERSIEIFPDDPNQFVEIVPFEVTKL